jgi:hypothetical protein
MRRPTRWLCSALLLVAGCATAGKPAATPDAPPRPLPPAAEQGERVLKRVDPRTGITSYQLFPDIARSRAGELSLTCFLLSGPGGPGPHDLGQLGFQVTSKQMRFNLCDRLTVELDGERLPPRSVKHFNALSSGQVVEAVVTPIAVADLERLARARKVAYRLCQTTGELSAAELALLQKMVGLWQAPVTPPAARPR